MGTVYALADPRNGLIRYVGATTTDLTGRISGHLWAARQGASSPVSVWVAELLAADLRPTVSTIRAEVPNAELGDAEDEEIRGHHEAGWPLLNIVGLNPHVVARPVLGRRLERVEAAGATDLVQATRAAIRAHKTREELRAEDAERVRRYSAPPPPEPPRPPRLPDPPELRGGWWTDDPDALLGLTPPTPEEPTADV